MLKSELKQYLTRELSSMYDADETAAILGELLRNYLSDRSSTIIIDDFQVSSQTISQLKIALVRLKQDEPLQYVLGESWFYELPFYLNSHVLIPRPETEELVHFILSDINHSIFGIQHAMFRILDIGTGSGCIPVALKKNVPRAEVYGMDISADALEIAKRNAHRNEVDVTWVEADILNSTLTVPASAFTIIVSNPPYITNVEKAEMHSNVLLHEPHLALFVTNNDPLQFYKAIASFAAKNLVKGGRLYVEINAQYGKEVKSCFEGCGFSEVTITTDMQGKERIVSGIWK